MKLISFILFATILNSTILLSQNSYGLLFGSNVSGLKSIYVGNDKGTYKFGAHMGIFYKFQISKRFAFENSIEYSQKGWVFNDRPKGVLSLDFFDFKVLLKHLLFEKLEFHYGLHFGHLLRFNREPYPSFQYTSNKGLAIGASAGLEFNVNDLLKLYSQLQTEMYDVSRVKDQLNYVLQFGIKMPMMSGQKTRDRRSPPNRRSQKYKKAKPNVSLKGGAAFITDKFESGSYLGFNNFILGLAFSEMDNYSEFSLSFYKYSISLDDPIFKMRDAIHIELEYFKSLFNPNVLNNKLFLGYTRSIYYSNTKTFPKSTALGYPIHISCFCASGGVKLVYLVKLSSKFCFNISSDLGLIHFGLERIKIKNPNTPAKPQNSYDFYDEFFLPQYTLGIGFNILLN